MHTHVYKGHLSLGQHAYTDPCISVYRDTNVDIHVHIYTYIILCILYVNYISSPDHALQQLHAILKASGDPANATLPDRSKFIGAQQSYKRA